MDNALTKYRFFGTLASGKEGMVVAIRLPSLTEAYWILRMHANLRSFVAVEE